MPSRVLWQFPRNLCCLCAWWMIGSRCRAWKGCRNIMTLLGDCPWAVMLLNFLIATTCTWLAVSPQAWSITAIHPQSQITGAETWASLIRLMNQLRQLHGSQSQGIQKIKQAAHFAAVLSLSFTLWAGLCTGKMRIREGTEAVPGFV